MALLRRPWCDCEDHAAIAECVENATCPLITVTYDHCSDARLVRINELRIALIDALSAPAHQRGLVPQERRATVWVGNDSRHSSDPACANEWRDSVPENVERLIAGNVRLAVHPLLQRLDVQQLAAADTRIGETADYVTLRHVKQP